ncbi:MAG TPA: sugar phosphate isomerase [Armatimonadota bacterium]|nr:sugar phosphate isomerase [Armatimonadota bacterium]
MMNYIEQAQRFVDEETQFHLGFLPTEQSSPLTRGLDAVFAGNTMDGVRMLQRVDWNVLEMAERILVSDTFHAMVKAGVAALQSGHKIVFSGCGSTGRLSVLLEAMWRRYFLDHPGPLANRYGDAVFSIMTGGDYALIRAVEFFEDYQEFGRQQVRELGMGNGDMLIAITEGGETSSVLGTVDEAARRGVTVFLLFNNPAELIHEKLERCRQAIDNPRVTVLDLSCGPMAIAGSTRMQATTAEQLIAGAALEEMIYHVTDSHPSARDYAAEFRSLLEQLGAPESVEAIANYLEFEVGVYSSQGLITYFADDFLLDIFTDTTERTPTFMLPPFRQSDDRVSPQSWAFVKNPLLPTPEAWQRCLSRAPRCLSWGHDDYERMGAADKIAQTPPQLGPAELMKFIIGNEDTPCRYQDVPGTAVLIGAGNGLNQPEFAELEAVFERASVPYQQRKRLLVGIPDEAVGAFVVPFHTNESPLRLMEHLALKLVMNTISTGTMVRMGRVSGNWMTWVNVSNKKLLDRGVRLVAELCGIPYRKACEELFKSIEELKLAQPSDAKPSPVQYTLNRLNARGVHNEVKSTVRES